MIEVLVGLAVVLVVVGAAFGILYLYAQGMSR